MYVYIDTSGLSKCNFDDHPPYWEPTEFSSRKLGEANPKEVGPFQHMLLGPFCQEVGEKTKTGEWVKDTDLPKKIFETGPDI